MTFASLREIDNGFMVELDPRFKGYSHHYASTFEEATELITDHYKGWHQSVTVPVHFLKGKPQGTSTLQVRVIEPPKSLLRGQ